MMITTKKQNVLKNSIDKEDRMIILVKGFSQMHETY